MRNEHNIFVKADGHDRHLGLSGKRIFLRFSARAAKKSVLMPKVQTIIRRSRQYSTCMCVPPGRWSRKWTLRYEPSAIRDYNKRRRRIHGFGHARRGRALM